MWVEGENKGRSCRGGATSTNSNKNMEKYMRVRGGVAKKSVSKLNERDAKI